MARLENKIEKAIKPLTEMYEKIENDLLEEIASHFSYKSEFLNSDYWRIQKLDEMGLFNQQVVDYIARYSNRTKEEVLNTLQQIGIDTINLDNLNRIFEDEILKVNPNVLKDNYIIQKMINTTYNEVSNRFIQLSSQVEEATRKAYLNVVEEVYLKTTMGTHSYQEAITTAIDQLGNKGLTILSYKITDENGNVTGIRNYDIAGTVRREILTASRQLSNNINMEVANQLGCEYLYLSEHIRCRPQHFDWQGTIIKRKDLVKITDYGSITGLAGINCAHYFEPYFGNARGNDLKKIPIEEATKQYNLSQKQRYLERGVKKWKRKTEMFKASEDNASYKKSKNKTREWQSRLKKLTEDNELKRDYTREYVNINTKNNLSRNIKNNSDNIINKTLIRNVKGKDYIEEIEKYEKNIFNEKIENAIIIEENGNVYKFTGVDDYVNIYGNLKNSIITHNHPSYEDEIGGSFGKNDFTLLVNHQDIKEMRVVDEKYTYKMKILKKLSYQDYNEAYINAKIIDDDYKHCVMMELKERGLIHYERNVRK